MSLQWYTCAPCSIAGWKYPPGERSEFSLCSASGLSLFRRCVMMTTFFSVVSPQSSFNASILRQSALPLVALLKVSGSWTNTTPASFVPVGYLSTSINHTSRRATIPQLCFDVRLCQKFPDQFHQRLADHRPLQVGIVCDSWSVNEHDPLAVQLKLVGCLDSAGSRTHNAIPDSQTRTTSAVYELQLQSLESENRSYKLSSLPWFSHTSPILSH